MKAERFLDLLQATPAAGAELRDLTEFQVLLVSLEEGSRTARTGRDGKLSLKSPIDWPDILEKAEALAQKGNDLRLLVIVLRALTNLDGFAGLAAGLDLIRSAVETRWDTLHPELRDSDQPAKAVRTRMNALRQIENTESGTLADLEMSVVFDLPGFDPLRGVELVRSGLSEHEYLQIFGGLSDQETATRTDEYDKLRKRANAMCLAMRDQKAADLSGILQGLDAAHEAHAKLIGAFNSKAELQPEEALTLPDLQQFIDRCKAVIAASDNPEAGGADASSGPDGSATVGAAQPSAPAAGGSLPGRLNSRADVEKALDLVLEFYNRNEPASPIPHIVARIRRMVPMDFLELMNEIAPSGLNDFKKNAGIDGKRKTDDNKGSE
ncbi:MAG: type VI secretion system ImpA family N-terminal domain-containing protein [Pseudomonadota bacterium]